MAIPTSRTSKPGRVAIDDSLCLACGNCATVCKSFTILWSGDGPVVDADSVLGCIACGQCAAVCAQNAVTVEGRCLSSTDILPLPPREMRASYDQLHALMLSRRSIRDFRDKPVAAETIQRVLDFAGTAPMGIPPSDVSVLVLDGREQVRSFVGDFINHIQSMRWMFSSVMLRVFSPFMSRESREMMQSFMNPVLDTFIEKFKKGEDWVLYNAPLAMLFHCSPYSDVIDPYIPATYAMFAAESLGLGTCMIGSVTPFLKSGAKAFRKKWGIPPKNTPGIIVIFGYPKVHFSKGIKRTFASVTTFRSDQ